jgi:hypothetical protein
MGMPSEGGFGAAAGPEFMSALLTFILAGAIIHPLRDISSAYPKAILVCQGLGSGA